jgi:uncharacterized membrane protein
MKTSRAIVGILVTPLVAPLVFYLISIVVAAMTQGEGHPIPIQIAYLYGAPIAYSVAIFLGLPTLVLMRRFHLNTLRHAVIAGIGLGWLPFVVPLLIPSDFRAGYTMGDYLSALMQSFLIYGTCGMASAVSFWCMTSKAR